LAAAQLKTFHIYLVPTFHQVWEVETESEEAVKDAIEENYGFVPDDAVLVAEQCVTGSEEIMDIKET
jgi:hypothetical protein